MDAETLRMLALLTLSIVIGALAMAFGAKRNNKQRRAARKEGAIAGYETAKAIGVLKAYRIAENLPDCSYREGYFAGISTYELEQDNEA